MILGFDAKRAFSNFTGLGNYSRSTIALLAERHPESRFLLFTPPFLPHRELAFADRENIEVVQPVGLGRRLPTWWRAQRVGGLAQAAKVGLFHGLSGELPSGLGRRGVRSVVTIHDLIFLRYPQFYGALDRWIYRRKFEAACRDADRIIAISEATKRDLIDLLGADARKIRLVYQGCNPQFYDRCSDETRHRVAMKYGLPETFVLYVGTIEHRKNLVTLVRALAGLPKACHLVAIGRLTPYAAEVEAEIARLGVKDRVIIIPKSDFRDLPAVYQLARVFALPALFEGFGIPLLEALNSGTPIVASATSSLPEAGGEQGIYRDPMDVEGFADAIRRLLPDSDFRQRTIERGRAHALRFREEEIATRLWGVYEELA